MIESYLKDLPNVESNYELINDYKECIEDIESLIKGDSKLPKVDRNKIEKFNK